MNTLDTNNIKWSENVIIADADYIDRVAFDLTVNFERMINRRIQPADMAQWAVCIALDHILSLHCHSSTRISRIMFGAKITRELISHVLEDMRLIVEVHWVLLMIDIYRMLLIYA